MSTSNSKQFQQPGSLLRSPWAVSLSVWKALLLREGMTRLLSTQTAWFWFLFEPLAHTLFMLVMMTVVRSRTVGGIHTGVWLVAGLYGFLMFKRIAMQAAGAIGSNVQLFAFRQIMPIDFVIARAVLEAVLLTLVFSLMLLLGELLGIPALPDDPLAVLAAVCANWLLALGFGLVVSVASELILGFRRVLGFLMIPLYFSSGLIMQLRTLPHPWPDLLLTNPVAQSLELIRHGFSPLYHAAPGVSLGYVYAWALGLMFLGLLLQRRFLQKLRIRRQ